jgi:hypothetical protein
MDTIKDGIRTELEMTRTHFHAMLAAIPAGAFSKPTENPQWNVGEVLYHMSLALRNLPVDVRLIRRLGWIPTPPAFIFHRLNEWATRRGGRDATHETLAQAYDNGHARTLQALEKIGDDEWSKGAQYPDWDSNLSGFVTLERLFHYPRVHFEAHAAELARFRRD